MKELQKRYPLYTRGQHSDVIEGSQSQNSKNLDFKVQKLQHFAFFLNHCETPVR